MEGTAIEVGHKAGLAKRVREARAAMRSAQAAAMERIIVGQSGSIVDDALFKAAAREDEVGRAAAAFVEARRGLNDVLRRRDVEAARHAQELANAVVSEVLGQSVPGTVELAEEGGHHRAKVTVIGVEALFVTDEGQVSGMLRVQCADGRGSETRSFGHVDGRFALLMDVDF
jgi:hypothetical protein